MRFINDEARVLAQLAVALRLGEQDAVGHELDGGALAELLVESHLVADHLAQPGVELLGDARGNRTRGDAPRLGMADAPALHLEQQFRQLGGFPRAGLAANDDYGMALDRGSDFFASLVDGQRGVEADAHASAVIRAAGRRNARSGPLPD